MSRPAPPAKVRGRTLRRRLSRLAEQVFAEFDGFGPVDFEHDDGDAADGGATHEDRAVPGEMAAPAILAGVEEPHPAAGLRVQPRDVRPLVAVAEEAGQGEVFGDGGAFVLAGDDMINGLGQRREGLGQLAAFVAGVGTLPD